MFKILKLSIFARMSELSDLKIGIVGSGSWATAMIKMLTDNVFSKKILWWVRRSEDRDYIVRFRHNPSYLSSVEIKVHEDDIYVDARGVIVNADIIVLNTPAAYLKEALKDVTALDFKDKIVVSAIKGIIPDENLAIADYLVQYYDVDLSNIVVVGGPCHAEEVAREKLSYLTFGCVDLEIAKKTAGLFSSHYIQTITSLDPIGIEYCAILKNIYALAGGIAHGLGYGDNFQAVLVSNALREMSYFVTALSPLGRDIKSSAYLGDLLVTAYSQFSRNRTFGNMIGKGYTVQSAQLEMNMVAEGYYASACIQSIIKKHNLNMPICNMVYEVLYNHKPANSEVAELAKNFT